MGKVMFQRDKNSLINSPMILKQLAAKNKRLQLNTKKIVKAIRRAPKVGGSIPFHKPKTDPTESSKDMSVSCVPQKVQKCDNSAQTSECRKRTIEDCETNMRSSKHFKGNNSSEVVEMNECMEIDVPSGSTVVADTDTVEVTNPEMLGIDSGITKDDDMLCTTENECNQESLNTTRIFHQVIDEICLEGLDGITLEGLWVRLKHAFKLPLHLNSVIKNSIWKMICNLKEIQLYILEEPREKLKIFNRYKYMDTVVGIVMEPTVSEKNIYPFHPINEPETKIRGSCSTYYTRTKASEELKRLSYMDVMSMCGSSLVLVATQALRENALRFEYSEPTLSLLEFEYYLLERIARSRSYGELTQGKMSLQDMLYQPHYHSLKTLIKEHLVRKQFFYIKSTTCKNMFGSLYQLSRFFSKVKPKGLVQTEQIFNAIKEKPGMKMDLVEFRKLFGHSDPLSKLFKSAEFQKYIKTDGVCRYRDIYANAKRSEWKRVSLNKEKIIRVLEIRDPYVNIQACWDMGYAADEGSSDEEETVNESYLPFGTTEMRDVYLYMLEQGEEGANIKTFEKRDMYDFYTRRHIIKNLLDEGLLRFEKEDIGRQRIARYYVKNLKTENGELMCGRTDTKKMGGRLMAALKRQKLAYEKNNGAFDDQSESAAENQSIETTVEGSLVGNCWKFLVHQNKPPLLINEPSNEVLLSIPNLVRKVSSTDVQVTLSGSSNRISSLNEDCFEGYIHTCDKKLIDLMLVSNTNEDVSLSVLFETTEEECINDDIIDLNIDDREAKLTSQATDVNASNESINENEDIKFMGLNPVVVVDEIDEFNLRTRITMSTPSSKVIEPGTHFGSKVLTKQVIRRTNMILDLMNANLVLSQTTKIMNKIIKLENDLGIKSTMCRKSLAKILKRLIEEGYIKAYKVVISFNNFEQSQLIFCYPSMQHDDQMILDIREQLKMKLCTSSAKKVPYNFNPNKPVKVKVVQESTMTSLNLSRKEFLSAVKVSNKSIVMKPNQLKSKEYGYKPKFIRMQILHEFLFYVIYEMPDEVIQFDLKNVSQFSGIDIDGSEIDTYPPVYRDEISWKTFVFPLPKHIGWTEGWALVSDLLLRLPLSIFVEINKVSFECQLLREYLNHPIKKYLPIKFMPIEIRDVLFYKRQHFFHFHDSLCLLVYIGLLQFGPQQFKEKDQVFIYLNRYASLLNTLSSKPCYCKVTEKNYEKKKFYFDSSKVLNQYWNELWMISMNTPLGHRLSAEKYIGEKSYKYLGSKPSFMQALKPRSTKSAPLFDIGDIPGDNRGAAGLDSSLWAHLKRNWNWVTTKKSKENSRALKENENSRLQGLEKVKPRQFSYLSSKQNKIINNRPVKEHVGSQMTPPKGPVKAVKQQKQPKMVVCSGRKVRKSSRTVQYFDSVDKEILKRFGVMHRCKWSKEEDELLEVMRAASFYMCGNRKKPFVAFTTIRDILHIVIPTSCDKTSRSVQGRISRYINKDDSKLAIVMNFSRNFEQLAVCKKYFNKIKGALNAKPTTIIPNSDINIAFIYLMSYIMPHYQQVRMFLHSSDAFKDYLSPKNIEIYRPKITSIETKELDLLYAPPKNLVDIKIDVIKNVIHGALNYHTNENARSFQVFRIYENFPDELLRAALASLRSLQIVSFKKNFVKGKKTISNHIPYQLSNTYKYKNRSTFQTKSLTEAFDVFMSFVNGTDSKEVEQYNRYGSFIGYNEVSSIWKRVQFDLVIPDKPVMLNPNIKNHAEVIKELAIRYQMYLKFKNDINNEETQNLKANAEVLPAMKETDLFIEKLKDETVRYLCEIKFDFIESVKENFIRLVGNQSDNNCSDLFFEDIKKMCIQFIIENTKDDNCLFAYLEKLLNEFQAEINKVDHLDKVICFSKMIKSLHTFFQECYCKKDQDMSDFCFESRLTSLFNIISSLITDVINQRNQESREDKNVIIATNANSEPAIETNDSELKVIENEDVTKNYPSNSDFTLEQIMEALIDDSDVSSRLIPNAAELSNLLSNDRFPDFISDENKLKMKSLKSYFITVLPSLQNVSVPDREEFVKNSTVQCLLHNQARGEALLNSRKQTLYKSPCNGTLEEIILGSGRTSNDHQLALEILDFIHKKEDLGVYGNEFLKYFGDRRDIFELEQILKTLVSHNFLMRTGITQITFVHHEYRTAWLTATYPMSQSEINECNSVPLVESVKQQIAKSPQERYVRFMPWLQVDGSINDELLHRWLTIVLSHCVENPCICFRKLCERYFVLRPVDMYYLLEILEEIHSVKISIQEKYCDFDSEEVKLETRKATLLDKFDDMFIEVNNASLLALAAIWSSNSTRQLGSS